MFTQKVLIFLMSTFVPVNPRPGVEINVSMGSLVPTWLAGWLTGGLTGWWGGELAFGWLAGWLAGGLAGCTVKWAIWAIRWPISLFKRAHGSVIDAFANSARCSLMSQHLEPK